MSNQVAGKFEELECWQEARQLVKIIYQVTGEGSFAKDFGLRDQVRRASVSIMANIAEGFGSSSNAEFVRFLRIATRSCLEVQSHSYVAMDSDYVDQETFEKIYKQAQKCLNYLRGLIRYLRDESFSRKNHGT